MLEVVPLILITLIFLLAGGIKGFTGLGITLVSIALLTAIVGLQPAMALLLVPSFVTNVWQAMVGGNGRAISARIWPFLLAATVTVWIGVLTLTQVKVSLLSVLLGTLLILYLLTNLYRPQVSIPQRWETWAGPLIGTINGILTGMTGTFIVPGVFYLQAIGLPRDMLIQAMGILFMVLTLALAVSLGGQHLLTIELGVISAAAILPAMLGMLMGHNA